MRRAQAGGRGAARRALEADGCRCVTRSAVTGRFAVNVHCCELLPSGRLQPLGLVVEEERLCRDQQSQACEAYLAVEQSF